MLQTQRLRAAHADSRLPQILDAAAQRFCTQGYQGTTIRDIARAVGILPGSLYCHFATKQAGVLRVEVEYWSATTRDFLINSSGVPGLGNPYSNLNAHALRVAHAAHDHGHRAGIYAYGVDLVGRPRRRVLRDHGHTPTAASYSAWFLNARWSERTGGSCSGRAPACGSSARGQAKRRIRGPASTRTTPSR